MATDLSTEVTLNNGDNLTREEFLHIWEQLPDVKFAELIGGIVYMPSPLRREHSTKDRRVSGWLLAYEAQTQGCEGGNNATTFMGDECLQPDGFLAILPECGGKSGGEEYVEGAPELIFELAHSSASFDLHQKLNIYESAGVQEYLVFLLKKKELRWHRLVKGKYKQMKPDADGVWRSHVFPGLWLDSAALFGNDHAKVLAKLHEGIASDEHQKFVERLAAKRKRSTK